MGGLKCFVGVNMNIRGLEGPSCWSSRARKEVEGISVSLLSILGLFFASPSSLQV